MLAHALQFLRGGRWFRWVTGPILEKELRCASRRRRNYVLRAVYVLLLAAMLGLMLASMCPRAFSSSIVHSEPTAAGTAISTNVGDVSRGLGGVANRVRSPVCHGRWGNSEVGRWGN